MNKNALKISLFLLLIIAVSAFFTFDLQQYATLNYIKTQQFLLDNYYQQHKIMVLVLFGAAYVIVTAISLPVATMMTLLGGALFGFWTGLIIVSFASSLGATIAFLIARFLFKDLVQQKYGDYFKKINDGFASEGAFYLFALRLLPIVPFFIVNILMSLLPMRARVFYMISQLGMLPSTAIYVYAGTELSKIETLSDIISPSLLVIFTLLALFPIIAKKLLNFIRQRKIS